MAMRLLGRFAKPNRPATRRPDGRGHRAAKRPGTGHRATRPTTRFSWRQLGLGRAADTAWSGLPTRMVHPARERTLDCRSAEAGGHEPQPAAGLEILARDPARIR